MSDPEDVVTRRDRGVFRRSKTELLYCTIIIDLLVMIGGRNDIVVSTSRVSCSRLHEAQVESPGQQPVRKGKVPVRLSVCPLE